MSNYRTIFDKKNRLFGLRNDLINYSVDKMVIVSLNLNEYRMNIRLYYKMRVFVIKPV